MKVLVGAPFSSGGSVDQGVFEIGARKPVTLAEANEIVRIIARFTKSMAMEVDRIINRLESIDPNRDDTIRELEAEVELIIDSWNQKVRKLGAEPKGLWMADLDAGDGYYCWKYPENEINYWHDYKSGFPGRIPLRERKSQVVAPVKIVVEPNLI